MGQLVNQGLDGANLTDKRTRHTGISRDIAADIVMLMQAEQRLRNTAAVLCTNMCTQSRFGRFRSVGQIRIALGRMLVNTGRFRCVAAIVVVMGTFLFQYWRCIPTVIRMRRMMGTHPAVCLLSSQYPNGAQVQAQSQRENGT